MNWFKKFWQGLTRPQPSGALFMDERASNFTPRSQQVLRLAREEAGRLNHDFLGTEHLLLGLLKLGQGVAVNVLAKLGLDLENVRAEVEKPELALASAICRTCCVRHDLAERVNDAYRQIWPEFRPVTVSPGTEAVQ